MARFSVVYGKSPQGGCLEDRYALCKWKTFPLGQMAVLEVTASVVNNENGLMYHFKEIISNFMKSHEILPCSRRAPFSHASSAARTSRTT